MTQPRKRKAKRAGAGLRWNGFALVNSGIISWNYDKLSKLAALVLDLKVGTPYGQKVKAYARFVLGQGDDPTREVLPHEQEGSESYARTALSNPGRKETT